MDISVVIPVHNEYDALVQLYDELTDVLDRLGQSSEIVFVGDGSNDGSSTILDDLARSDPRVQVVHFRRNYGQTAALMAGFQHSTGDVIIPMDADGQNDPADIPSLLDRLAQGFDVVSGWRSPREDGVSRAIAFDSCQPPYFFSAPRAAARLWPHPQGLSARGHRGRAPLWRDAPLYPDLRIRGHA